MAKVPAHCAHCGAEFYAENFIGGTGAKNLMLTGCGAQCPQCGKMASLVDGVFDLEDDELILIDGPPLTRAMMARLKAVADKARQESLTADEILAEVAGVSPEFAEKLRKKGLGSLYLILLLFWLSNSCSFSVKIDVNELVDQVRGVEQSDNLDQFFETPPPNQPKVPNEPAHPIWAAQSEALVSRQVRRQLERQAKKRAKPRKR